MSSYDTAPLPPQPESQPASAPTPAARRRGPGWASLLTVSLLLGGAGGFGGAALWEQTSGEWPDSTPTSTTTDSEADDSGDSASGSTPDSALDPTPQNTPALAPGQRGSVEQVAAATLPSVVKIDVSNGQGQGSGSGIILDEGGRILTNEHVVAVAQQGGSIQVSMSDGSTATAKILGTDPLTDTAVIQADDVSGLTPATIGKSAELAVGAQVVAVGSPFGLASTVTSGIVSALDRPVNVGRQADGGSTTYPAIQTDAAINPGNSGGALVNDRGEVIGINSSIRTAAQSSPFGESAGGSIGLGFAIPIDAVMPIVEQLSNGEKATHAQLGIQVSDTTEGFGQAGASQPSAVGAIVREVSRGSAAADAELAAGDVITKVDGRLISGADSLVATIRAYRPGDRVEVTYQRNGEEQSTELELESDG